MNICFSSIFTITRLQYELGIELARRGHSIFWVTTDPKWTNWLVMRDVDANSILSLNQALNTQLSDDDMDKARALRRRVEECSRHTVIAAHLADRFLNNRRDAEYLERIDLILYQLDEFFRKNQIEVIFGELTNLNDQLTAMLTSYRTNLKYLSPQDMRVPNSRFIIEDSVNSGDLLGQGSLSLDDAKRVVSDFKAANSQPRYFALWNSRTLTTDRPIKSVLSRVSSVFSSQRGALTRHHFWERVKTNLLRAILGRYLCRLFRYDQLPRGTRYVYFPLHVQPESSIDVKGRFFDDQIKLIRDIRRSLASDLLLVVKDHPNFLGQKGWSFYRKIRKLPGVVLLHPHTKNGELIASSEIVFTVSGTAAYEAGLYGRQAIMFSKQFFSSLPSISVCTDMTRLKSQIDIALKKNPPTAAEIVKSLHTILEKSFLGIWADPEFDRQVMERANIINLADGLDSALQEAGERKC